MTIALGQHTSAAAVTGGSGVNSISLTWPSATTAASYLQISLMFDIDPGTITWPFGLAIRGTTHHNGVSCYQAIGELVNAGSKSGSGSVSWVNAANVVAATMEEYTGVATSSPNDGADSTATGTGTAINNAGTSITTTNAGDIVLCSMALLASTGVINALTSPLPSPTTINDQIAASDAADGIFGRVASLANIPGSTGTFNLHCTSPRTSTWVATSYALLPGGGATRGLFRVPSSLAVGIGGSFFQDPLQKWDGKRDPELVKMARKAHKLAG